MKFSTLKRGAVRAVRDYYRRGSDVEALFKMAHVSPFQRRHFNKLCFSLLCISASSTLGAYTNGDIGSFFPVSGVIASIFLFHCIAPWHEKRRVFLLSLAAFYGGDVFALWFTWLLSVDTGFLVTFLLATSLGFGCFWIANRWADRFELVYFRAILLCSLFILLSLRFTSIVFGCDSASWKYELYPLLLWYMVYVAAYSQVVVVKTRRGESFYVKHVVQCFTDFSVIVIHVVKMIASSRRRA